MRRRLLVVLVPLAVLLVAALGVPHSVTLAEREMQETYVDRLGDVGRFASLAETALSTGRTEALQRELERYHELYGIPAAVIDTSGTVLLGPARAYREAAGAEPALPRIVTAALAGTRSEPSGAWAPWDGSALVVAEPVGRDSEVVGAVVTISDLSRTRSRVLLQWARLAGLGLLPLIALVAVAWPVSAWVLRPVRELDAASSRISQGDLTIRADAEAGPVELRRLAGSFNTMMDAVENAVQRQRAFVSDASHQLRNPLTSLRLAVESLEPHLAGDGRPVYEVAVDEVKAMQRLLNSLQASARMESIKTASPVELDAVLATRVDRWRALTGTAGQTLTVDVPGGLRLLEPTGGLGSILDELVSNALRLSEARVVEVSARTGSGDVVIISVRDDGQGIDVGERAQALRRFWRSPRHQNVPGTGLGLAICADLVGAAGGELRLEDGLPRPDGAGHGFAAVVTLPVAPPD
ncbi:two-component system sensor kinase [[Actinomadura] parvosata subsp. kistnae]|uniref:histidine kinase n=1 Tax=[Actinomadura] parvosata subsp. kistnae TaxID=1909395 RepID=A0A1V0ABZ0_9ACTN|nr:HAMP domain-containing sensor histidine kinase [Nonomuraea sp. ATCC 55076]AQZ67731.1 two-component sensor histidine kinase [Nonomuraea sp. ATCC 55076]SPL93972.1 two-component system sensor kinase [Actinomadura parvosata subsp. kistnae]